MSSDVPAIGLHRTLPREFLGYLAASLVALAIDLAMFSLCLRLLHMPWPLSATLGFALGVAVAYFLSVRWVFSQRRLSERPAHEFATFLLIGVVGLGITQAVLWLGVEQLHLPPELTRTGAAGVTFLFNYAGRALALFRIRQ